MNRKRAPCHNKNMYKEFHGTFVEKFRVIQEVVFDLIVSLLLNFAIKSNVVHFCAFALNLVNISK